MTAAVIIAGWVVASLLTAVAWSRLMRRTRTDATSPLVVHLCPPEGAAACPCCGRSLFELPRDDQVTVHVERVTCRQTEPVSDGAK